LPNAAGREVRARRAQHQADQQRREEHAEQDRRRRRSDRAGDVAARTDVKAIELCTVEGNAHRNRKPAQRAGVSRPGATAASASPTIGNTA
jgi:hypothetical protein